MKKIKLKAFYRADKKSIYKRDQVHKVYLGNGLTKSFSNIHDAQAYLATTNRMLNDLSLELNSVYIDAWSEYRRLYPIFFELLADQAHIIEHNSQIERTFNLLYNRSSYLNGNHFTFTRFYYIIEHIQGLCQEVLQVLILKRRNYNLFQLRILIRRLDQIRKNLESWGYEKQQDDEKPEPLI